MPVREPVRPHSATSSSAVELEPEENFAAHVSLPGRDDEPRLEEAMPITRSAALKMVKEMPETFELEELQHRIYLWQKLEAAEKDCDNGNSLSHAQALAEAATWFRG